MKKRILLFVISVIIIGSLPLLINWLILRPQLFNIAADGSTWLLFWASYIGAVASFAMVVTAWYTLKESRRQNDELLTQNEILIQQNKQQLEELKRQWEESHRPRLLFSIISHSGNYFLKICNIGKEAARNVTVSFSENFIENLLFKGTAMRLRQLETPFCIEPQSSKYYFLAPCKSTGKTISCDQESCTSEVANSWLEQHIADSIGIKCTYSEKYTVEETISIQMFSTPAAVINEPSTEYLRWIKEGLVFQNTLHRPIQGSIETLAKAIQSLDKKIAPEQDVDNNQPNSSEDGNQ